MAAAFFATSAFAQEPLHLHAQRLEHSKEQVTAQGDVRLFFDTWRLLAGRVDYFPQIQSAIAREAVSLQTPSWELEAESLDWHLQTRYIKASQVELRRRDQKLWAQSAEYIEGVWRLKRVSWQLPGLPLFLEADEFLFESEKGYWSAQQLGFAGGPRLPSLSGQWDGVDHHHLVRAPWSVFQPELAWVPGGLSVGLQSLLWQDANQRVLSRSQQDPILGFTQEMLHEWRPQPELLINTQFSAGQQGLSARGDAIWQVSENLLVRPEVHWAQPDDFFHRFALPSLQPPSDRVNSFQLWVAQSRVVWGHSEWRWLAGGRWPQNEMGLTLLGNGVLWQGPQYQSEWHMTGNALWRQGFIGTLGLRLLNRWFVQDRWEWDLYLEQFLSQIAPADLTEPERLSPWLGGMMLYHFDDHWGLGLESALSLHSGKVVRANALLSSHWGPWYIHVLFQGLPLGLQLQTRLEWD